MARRDDRAARRAQLLDLGTAVAAEMRAGQAGAALAAARDALAEAPDAVTEIVTLVVREGGRRKPDPHLVAALTFMAAGALEELRYGVERGDPDAGAALDAVRARLAAEARSGRADPAVVTLIAKQFAVARLDVGDALRDAMGDVLIERADEQDDGAPGGVDMERQLAQLGQELGDDAFAIYTELAETASSFPLEHRVAMASFMLASDAPAVKDAALGWLLDPSPEVRAAVSGALLEDAREGRLGAVALRRLVGLRNWLPQPDRDAIDGVVRAARRGGTEPSPSPVAAVEQLLASAFDGSGAISVFAIVKLGRRRAVVSVLLRLGEGLRDAWVHRDLTRAGAEAEMEHIARELELVPLSASVLRRLIAHGLSENRDAPPPFGALDAVEALGFGVVNPEPCEPAAILDEVLAGQGDEAEGGPAGSAPLADVEAVLAAGARWGDRFGFLDSWFEDDAAVAEALKGRKGLSRPRKVDLLVDRVVAPRRRRWGDLLSWTALITGEHDAEEAREFAVTAREILGDRPAAEIPFLRGIAERTLDARR